MTRLERAEVLVVGSGFAGAILARALHARGRDVLLVERGTHPRFALGESSTPLANIALERLAATYGFADLRHLAAWGRWRRHLPHLGCGLKRGFTFYAQPTGSRFELAARNANRLLVAASPDDEVSDTQWLRADVDAHLVERAVDEGMRYLDRCELRSCQIEAGGARCEGMLRRSSGDEALVVEAAFVVDASGPGGFLATMLGIAERVRPARFSTRLLFAHFDGLPPFSQVEPSPPRADAPAEPFPESWAAVHHLLDAGWMYQLRFDAGLVSAGFVVDTEREESLGLRLPWGEPERAFGILLERYPSLARQFEHARPRGAIAATGVLQRRLERAAGERWAVLPQAYAFYSPLFSTGIAWSLLGVERLAGLLGEGAGCGSLVPAAIEAGLERYSALLEREADHQEALLAAAYPLLHDLSRFSAIAQLYFAAASFGELRQRLLEPSEGGAAEGWCWQGFLGATDPLLRAAVEESPSRAARDGAPSELHRWVRKTIAPRNLIGLADPARQNLYPVEIPPLLAACRRLGLEPAELERRLPRLRGGSPVRAEASA
ncbi:MAG TPA: FAD-dependent oxidoreductase [Thermoanaerobaculia bacterium]|nr:FAD-dependent oxidoreductase [Thermoanaerobaculia bacterium]